MRNGSKKYPIQLKSYLRCENKKIKQIEILRWQYISRGIFNIYFIYVYLYNREKNVLQSIELPNELSSNRFVENEPTYSGEWLIYGPKHNKDKPATKLETPLQHILVGM